MPHKKQYGHDMFLKFLSHHIIQALANGPESPNTAKNWDTPFKIHTPPVEDFRKVNYIASVNFSNAPTFW